MVLQAIKYRRGSLEILDQLQLPHKIVYDAVESAEDAWHAIREMRVRGAPAIAIVAALGLAVELANGGGGGNGSGGSNGLPDEPDALRRYLYDRLDYLFTARPTAVNLGGAVVTLKAKLEEIPSAPSSSSSSSDASALLRATYLSAAERMLELDVRDNQAIGRHGSGWIAAHSDGRPVSILTHCNTGSLATAGYGTALGVIRSVHASGALKHAYCTETRPYNQGSRLTAFELVHDEIPATLITDSMACALMKLKRGSENIAAVVVGADRVAANGDTANKIGTYALAIAARFHGVKFLVAAPKTTIDMHTASGDDIEIEERGTLEMTSISGPRVTKSGSLDLSGGAERVSFAATGINVWNPAFDVTPAELIDGIVTEVGVAEKDPSGRFRLSEIMERTVEQTNGKAGLT